MVHSLNIRGLVKRKKKRQDLFPVKAEVDKEPYSEGSRTADVAMARERLLMISSVYRGMYCI
jgi:hypothetical protein